MMSRQQLYEMWLAMEEEHSPPAFVRELREHLTPESFAEAALLGAELIDCGMEFGFAGTARVDDSKFKITLEYQETEMVLSDPETPPQGYADTGLFEDRPLWRRKRAERERLRDDFPFSLLEELLEKSKEQNVDRQLPYQGRELDGVREQLAAAGRVLQKIIRHDARHQVRRAADGCEDAEDDQEKVKGGAGGELDLKKELHDLAWQVFEGTQRYMRWQLREHEKAALRGRKRQAGSQKGGERTRQKLSKREKVRAAHERQRAAEPGVKKTAHVAALAYEYKVAARTIYKYLQDPPETIDCQG